MQGASLRARYWATEEALVVVTMGERIGGKEDRPYCSYSGRDRSGQLRGWRILPTCEVVDIRMSAQVAPSNSVKTWPRRNGKGKAPPREA